MAAPPLNLRSGGVSRATVKKLIKMFAPKCCPPVIGGWGQIALPLELPQTIPNPGTNRLVFSFDVNVAPGLVQLFLETLKMEDPNLSSASIEIVPSAFGPPGTPPAITTITFTAGTNFDRIQLDLDTSGIDAGNYDIILTNVCGCCAVAPLQIVDLG